MRSEQRTQKQIPDFTFCHLLGEGGHRVRSNRESPVIRISMSLEMRAVLEGTLQR